MRSITTTATSGTDAAVGRSFGPSYQIPVGFRPRLRSNAAARLTPSRHPAPRGISAPSPWRAKLQNEPVPVVGCWMLGSSSHVQAFVEEEHWQSQWHPRAMG